MLLQGFTVDDVNLLQYLKDPKTMGKMVNSLLWVMQDFYHQP